ncbi:very short patch repair endonuclease [Saccharopolyspora rhizosphaerae]|uniref:Very short patch repair endonuclease n=1 Tax=Saccharopolyspora rhizosphaerae TaxID=2492662 RepID=A0A426JX11_9PSEU|nr:very short patch repair endonuclease [Saccharopolyspora rhizosphaerae]RRO17696.1 very short patch repair endonuclease [Saccharopolyspora rhizosphaerae]
MSRVRGRDTKPEIAIRSELHRRGLRFRVHQRPIESFRRTADIVFRPAMVAVMIDGCYWHGCPDHYRPSTKNSAFWQEKIALNLKRDQETNEALQEAGWLVLRFWEHESPVSVSDRIQELVTDRRASRRHERR